VDGTAVGPTLADFWGWSMSDLLNNTARGVLAEFIVALATGVPTDGVVREGWAAWDLTTPEGIKVEVKSAAYVESWRQLRPSTIAFLTPKTRAWDPETGMSDVAASRHADVYVFALLFNTDRSTLNPLCLDQWYFYVVPTWILNTRTRSQHSITLGTLQRLPAEG
jgi:hypothetical protein